MPNSKNFPLETERLILRLPELDDAPSMQAIIDDWDVAVTTYSIPHPYDLEMATSWITSVREQPDDTDQFSYMMIRQMDNQLLGGCGFNMTPHHESAALGYWVGKPYWGMGYATESAGCLIDFCFEELGMNRVEAAYYASNAASRRVMEKAGMTFEGIHRQAMIREIPSRNHRVYHDVGYCAILRNEWEANRG